MHRKTTRSETEPVVEKYVAIPRDFVVRNKMITLLADVFFVNGIAFLLSLSHGIKFMTIEHTPSCIVKQLTTHLKRFLRVYHHAGFTVRYILMDSESEKVKNELPPIVCNTTAAKDNVAETEH